jgi:hypothetical protein
MGNRHVNVMIGCAARGRVGAVHRSRAGARLAVGRAGPPRGRSARSAGQPGGDRQPVALHGDRRGAAGRTTQPSRPAPQGAAGAGQLHDHRPAPAGRGRHRVAPGNGLSGRRGTIGRLFDARVGEEMVATIGGDLARLKALAEEQAGTARPAAESTRSAPTAAHRAPTSRSRTGAPADDRADVERRRAPRGRRRLRQLRAEALGNGSRGRGKVRAFAAA